jgi:hypothetical protein
MVFKSFSTKDITNILKSLKSKNTHAYDTMPTRLLKNSVSYIYSPLTSIQNMYISSVIFSDCLKYFFFKIFTQKNKIK